MLSVLSLCYVAAKADFRTHTFWPTPPNRVNHLRATVCSAPASPSPRPKIAIVREGEWGFPRPDSVLTSSPESACVGSPRRQPAAELYRDLVGAWLAFLYALGPVGSRAFVALPQRGGIYVWSKRAFGDFAGFITAWTTGPASAVLSSRTLFSPPAMRSIFVRIRGRICPAMPLSTSSFRSSRLQSQLY